MTDRGERPDLDEPFSLYPMEGEDVLRRLLGAEEDDGETEPTEVDGS